MKRTLSSKAALLIEIIIPMVIVAIMPFKGISNTAFALTEADCRACHCDKDPQGECKVDPATGNPITVNTHHLFNNTPIQCPSASPYIVCPTTANYVCQNCHALVWDPKISAYTTEVIKDCTRCHSSADHTTVHDNKVMLDSTVCSQCHTANVVTEHNKYNQGCSVCHNSTNPTIIGALNKAKTSPPIYCYDCHGITDHGAAHDKAIIPYADCGSCHLANVVTEHANRNLSCSICHSSTDQAVIDAIAAGKGVNGAYVYCADCHSIQILGYFGNHVKQHDKTFIPAGACTDPSSATDVVTYHEGISTSTNQVYCFRCHSSTNSAVISAIDSGMAGAPVYCGNCHADGCLPNTPPVANAGPDQTMQTGQSVIFSGIGSDPDGSIVKYEWDFDGNGIYDWSNPTTGNTTYVYTTPGVFNAALRVTDNMGATGTDTAVVTVTASLPVNLALKKPTSASGSESGYSSSNAVDGNITTRWWKKSTSEQWIRVDLGSSMSISTVILKWHSYYAKDYYIDTSTDGSNWSNVKSVSGSDGGTDQNTFSSKTARYVRVRCKVAYNSYGYSLYEFEVYK